MTASVSVLAPGLDYPESDGKPIAETDLHRTITTDVIERLKHHFASQPDVYVSGNLLVAYVEGEPRQFLAPDCFVVHGVSHGDRRVFKTWDGGKAPEFVLEITLRTTRHDDLGHKKAIHQEIWKVQEHFLFDPREEYLEPSIQGFRRKDNGEYVVLMPSQGQFTSDVLGLRIERAGVRLVFRNPETGHEVLSAEGERARQAQFEAELAGARAEAREAEVAELLEHQNHLQAENERLRAELAALRRSNPS